MTIPISQHDLITPIDDILIENNILHGGSKYLKPTDGIFLHQVQQVDARTVRNNIIISDNVIKRTNKPINLSGVKGVTVINNILENKSNDIFIGKEGKDKCMNVETISNIVK